MGQVCSAFALLGEKRGGRRESEKGRQLGETAEGMRQEKPCGKWPEAQR